MTYAVILYGAAKNPVLQSRAACDACSLILQLLLTFVPKYYEHPYSVDIYTRYTEKLEGEYSAEKRRLLQELFDEYNVTIAEYPLHREEYLAGKMTLEEFSAYTDQNAVANAEISTVQYLLA